MWVTRVWASAHDESTVYLSLNGYRWDYFETMVYKSTDYGKTWMNIGGDIPHEPVNVIKEDAENPNILYVGTDHGLYISMDAGESFNISNSGIPAVAVHDVVVHPTTQDLIVGTHGRSIYKSNVKTLQQANLDRSIQMFAIGSRRANPYWGSQRAAYMEANEPEQALNVYTNEGGAAQLTITHGEQVVYSSALNLSKGFNTVNYDMSIDSKNIKGLQEVLGDQVQLKAADNGKTYLTKGVYQVSITLNDDSSVQEFTIK